MSFQLDSSTMSCLRMADEGVALRPTIHYLPANDYPLPSSSPYFKVQTTVSDSRLFERCTENPNPSPNKLCNSIFKEGLTQLLLEDGCLMTWHNYRTFAQQSGNYTPYKQAIVAAANFATILVSKDAISQYSNQSQLLSQMNDLWNYAASNHGKRGLSSAQAWKKCFSELEKKTDKYSLITEPYLGILMHDYHEAREHCRIQFNQPYLDCSPISYSRFQFIEKDAMYHEVNDEVRAMTSCLSLTVDEHTKLLVMIARGMISDVVTMFLRRLTPDLDTGITLDKSCYFRGHELELDLLFETLALNFQKEIWEDLFHFNSPMHAMGYTWGCYPSAALAEVLEVAELRRRALGTRFISVDMFVWSFYTCGYGLPSLDEQWLNTDSETHHLSLIYRAVIELVTSLGLKTIELEHFIFIVFHLEHPTGANVLHFREFMEKVEADMEERLKLTTRFCDFEDIPEGLFELKLNMLKKRKRTGAEGRKETS